MYWNPVTRRETHRVPVNAVIGMLFKAGKGKMTGSPGPMSISIGATRRAVRAKNVAPPALPGAG